VAGSLAPSVDEAAAQDRRRGDGRSARPGRRRQRGVPGQVGRGPQRRTGDHVGSPALRPGPSPAALHRTAAPGQTGSGRRWTRPPSGWASAPTRWSGTASRRRSCPGSWLSWPSSSGSSVLRWSSTTWPSPPRSGPNVPVSARSPTTSPAHGQRCGSSSSWWPAPGRRWPRPSTGP